MRTRNHQIKVWMDDCEYAALQKKVAASGQSQQTVILNAIQNASITSIDEVEQLKETNQLFAEYIKQLRGLATNVNQMAHIANATGALVTERTLIELNQQIREAKEEGEKIWQSIRQSISRPNHTVP